MGLLEELGQMWRYRAACRGNSELFFDPDRWGEARAICVSCPVYRECASYRDNHANQLHGGIWAGISMEDGAKSKRARNARRRLLTA